MQLNSLMFMFHEDTPITESNAHTHTHTPPHAHTPDGLEQNIHLVSCKTTLMSWVQTFDFSTPTSEHKYFTDIRRTEPLNKYTSTVFMCLCVFLSINTWLLKSYRLQFLNSCFWTFMPVLHFYVCVLVEGGLVCVCVSCLSGQFSCDWTLEDPAEPVLSHQAARTDLRR